MDTTRTCSSGKTLFGSRKKAITDLNKQLASMRKHGNHARDGRLGAKHAYRCRECQAWHLTKGSPRRRSK